MKLFLDGLGSGLANIIFEILAPASHDGYAENATGG